MYVLDKPVITRRELYLKRLLSLAESNNLIFVVGVRRSGKSCLTIQLEEGLRERCMEHERIIRCNFETTEAVRATAESLIADFQKEHTERLSHDGSHWGAPGKV